MHLTSICAAISWLIASTAMAQTPAPAAAEEDLAELVVTGSAIPVSQSMLAVPVTIVDADAIANAGVSTNVLEILRKSVPAFGGRSSTGNSNAATNNQNTAGGSSIQIRNLDTLILVNGRRVAADSIAGINGKVFVNVAAIPPAAIARIEVLTDGASAIYGSEAIGGVVNIILKSNYEGSQASVRFAGGATSYNEKSADLTVGFKPFSNTNVTASASYSDSSPLYQNQRPVASPFYQTSTAVPGAIGNFFLNPGITAPTPASTATLAANSQYTNAGAAVGTAPGTGVGGTYDLSKYQTLLLKQSLKAIAISLNSELMDDKVELFGDFEYAKNFSFTRWAPVTANVTVPAGLPYNPLTAAATVVFGSTANPKTYVTDKEAKRLTLGLRGQLPSLGVGWGWEVGLTHSENSVDQSINNVIYTSNLLRAASGGFNSSGVATPGGAFSQVLAGTSPSGAMVTQPALNPFGVAANMTAGALNNVLVNQVIGGKSKLDSADIKLTGTVGHLPGGTPTFAVGAAWRKEVISGAPTDPNAWGHIGGVLVVGATGTATGASQNLFTGGLVLDPFDSSRTISSAYVEARIPITGEDWNITGFRSFDLILAERYEKYSDFGNSSVPKIGFRWEPISKQVVIRGNYAKSYTAPSLYQIGGPLNVATSAAVVITNAFPAAIAGTSTQLSGSNSNLQPAFSQSYSLGMVLKPNFAPRLMLDLEYSRARETGQIQGIGLNNILLDVNSYGSNSRFYGNAATGALPGTPGAVGFAAPGAVLAYVTNPANLTNGVYTNLYLKDVPTNLGLIDVRSLNLNAEYSLPISDGGTVSFATQTAFLMKFDYQAIPGQPVYDFSGTSTQGGGAQGTLPKVRAYTSVTWDIGNWNAEIGNTYVSAVDDIGTGGFSYFTNLATNPVSFAAGRIKSFQAWDARLSYHTAGGGSKGNGLTLTAGVNNLTDEMPPVSSNIDPAGGHAAGATAWRSENNADLSSYGGAIGRLVYVSASYKFR
jgi:iron complex outermembrane receptor protein